MPGKPCHADDGQVGGVDRADDAGADQQNLQRVVLGQMVCGRGGRLDGPAVTFGPDGAILRRLRLNVPRLGYEGEEAVMTAIDEMTREAVAIRAVRTRLIAEGQCPTAERR